MEIIKYATKSKYGFQKMNDNKTFKEHLKYLHKNNVSFYPLVLVEGVPGETDAKWLKLNEYNKLLKEEQEDGCY